MFTRRLLKLKIHSRRVLIFKRSLPIFAFLLAGLNEAASELYKQKTSDKTYCKLSKFVSSTIKLPSPLLNIIERGVKITL